MEIQNHLTLDTANFCASYAQAAGAPGASLELIYRSAPEECALSERLIDLAQFVGHQMMRGKQVLFFKRTPTGWRPLLASERDFITRGEMAREEDDPTGKNVICFYHKDCLDGMGAAWAVWKRYPEAQFFPMNYGDPIPCEIDLQHTVVVVDFAFSLATMDELTELGGQLIFLDHHESSRPVFEYLRDRQEAAQAGAPIKKDFYRHTQLESGAGLAWRYFHPNTPVPDIIRCIEDQDLWLFSYPDTKAVIAGLSQHPLDLEKWQLLLATPDAVDIFRMQGGAILNKQESEIEWLVRVTKRMVTFTYQEHTFHVPLINSPRYITSVALDKLADEWPFVAAYYDTEHDRVFSLRSAKGHGMNVCVIAQQFPGGGGHAHAAGFRVPRTHELAQL